MAVVTLTFTDVPPKEDGANITMEIVNDTIIGENDQPTDAQAMALFAARAAATVSLNGGVAPQRVHDDEYVVVQDTTGMMGKL